MDAAFPVAPVTVAKPEVLPELSVQRPHAGHKKVCQYEAMLDMHNLCVHTCVLNQIIQAPNPMR